MADRTCPTCKIVFKYPSILKKHFETTIHCIKTDDEIKDFINNNKTINKTCNRCNKIFTRQDNYNRHISNLTCTNTSINTVNTNKLTKENMKKLLKVKKTLLNEQNSTNVNINNNNNNTTNNVTININNTQINIQHIYPFGFEKLPNISKDKMKALLLSGDKGVIEIIKLVYEQDENKNFYKMNMKTNNISYLNDKYKLDICQENEMKETLYKNCISLPNDMLVICKDILTTNEILFINSNNKNIYEKIKEEIYDNGLKNIINNQLMYNSKNTKTNINKYLEILNTNPIVKQEALNNLTEIITIANKTRDEFTPKLSIREINNKLGDPVISPELSHELTYNEFCMKKFEDTKYKKYWDKRKKDESKMIISLEDKKIGDIVELDKRISNIDYKLNKMALIHNDITFQKGLENVEIASDYVCNNSLTNDVGIIDELQRFTELESQ
jgi:uncharacterized C2H2 Zn-finger protein